MPVHKGPERATTRPTVLSEITQSSMSTDDSAGVESPGTTTAVSPAKPPTAIDWDGPFLEFNAYDDPTGYTYVRCPDCEIEVLTTNRTHATHRQGCPHR